MTSIGVLYREAGLLFNIPNWVASTHTLHARKLNKGTTHLFKTHSDGIKFRKESWIKPHLSSYHVRGELGKPENKFSSPVCAAMCAKYVLPTKVPACWKIIGRESNADKEENKNYHIYFIYSTKSL